MADGNRLKNRENRDMSKSVWLTLVKFGMLNPMGQKKIKV